MRLVHQCTAGCLPASKLTHYLISNVGYSILNNYVRSLNMQVHIDTTKMCASTCCSQGYIAADLATVTSSAQ